jgi:hypothetical protein
MDKEEKQELARFVTVFVSVALTIAAVIGAAVLLVVGTHKQTGWEYGDIFGGALLSFIAFLVVLFLTLIITED